MGTKLLIISMDAMIAGDLPHLAQYPAFRKYMKEAACVRRVRSIYPTLTYPCHTTMLTGAWPDKHGVTANEQFLPGTRPLPWNFYHDAVRCRDLFDVCRENGMTTASVSWPATGSHPSVEHLVDEIWPMGEMTEASLREALLSSGTEEALYETAVKPYTALRIPRGQPASSFFATMVACAILREKRPDVMAVHLSNFDGCRHAEGVFGPHTERAAAEADTFLALFLRALAANGDEESCNVVVTSDHGQMDCVRCVNPNVLLKEAGFITTDAAGRVTDWRAWCLPMGMSAQIILRDPADKALSEAVFTFLSQRAKEGVWGFSEVLREEETRTRDHLGGAFSFVLETDNYTTFEGAWTGPGIVPATLFDCGPRHGSHGFHPDKGPRPPFLAKGPAFRPGASLECADLVDEAPTCAAAIGLSLPDADGKVLSALLR